MQIAKHYNIHYIFLSKVTTNHCTIEYLDNENARITCKNNKVSSLANSSSSSTLPVHFRCWLWHVLFFNVCAHNIYTYFTCHVTLSQCSAVFFRRSVALAMIPFPVLPACLTVSYIFSPVCSHTTW